MLRYLNIPNAITLLGSTFALAAVAVVARGQPHAAFALLLLSAVCDFLDGAVARGLPLSDEERTFGGHLDSISDACAFGVCPPVVLYLLGFHHPLELALQWALAAAAIWRLTYFETHGMEQTGAKRAYVGLPVTAVSLVIPLVALASSADRGAMRVALGASAALLAPLMVSGVRIPKPRGVALVVILLLALGTAAAHVWLAVGR